MSPPFYAGFGRNAKGILNNGYNYGFLQMDSRTKNNNTQYKTSFNYGVDEGKSVGWVERQHKWDETGITFTGKFNTDRVFKADLRAEDVLVNGLDVTANGSYAPDTNKKTAVLRSTFRNDLLAMDCSATSSCGDMLFKCGRPTLQASAAVGHEGFMTGGQLVYDTAVSRVKGHSLAVGYQGGRSGVTLSLNNADTVQGFVSQRVSSNLDVAATVSYTQGSGGPRDAVQGAVGARYRVTAGAALAAKLTSQGSLGLSYTQRLWDGVSVCVSSLLDGKRPCDWGHKVGLGLDLEFNV